MSTLSSDLRTLSYEAYLYLYPLVTMETTRRQAGNFSSGQRPGFGPPNEFHHLREFPSAEFRAVVRPNFDTLYSSAWLDLTRGPVSIQVPDSGDRYFMLPMLDMWTDVFANPGKRTTGTESQNFFVTFPGASSTGIPQPAGSTVITAPTPYVWIIGRVQTNGPADYPAVREFQDGLRISELAPPASHHLDPDLDTTTEPLRLVNAMRAVEFYTRAAELLKTVPPHPTDFDQLARLRRLGMVPGEDFDASQFSAGQAAEVEAGAAMAREAIREAPATMGTATNGWVTHTETMGVYGNYYFKRAMVTLVGLGANPVEDAIYPLLLSDINGNQPSGDTDYVMHFDADQLPPAEAFWSITMYDAEGYQVANEFDRFAIGDRDPLVYNDDGSLDIYIQRANPGPKRESNWLPARSGPIGITMRLYAPKARALDGTWAPPAVRGV